MLVNFTQEEIKTLMSAISEGKTYGEAIDELYPKTEMQCIYECAEENSRSFSVIKAIYNAITKREQPELSPCDCLPCVECLA